MKSIPSLRIFKLAMAATLAIIIVWGLSIQPAQANSYVVTLKQVGPNVVATGSGAIDLTGLMSLGNVSGGPIITPRDAFIVTGPAGFFEEFFSPSISGPTSFGSGSNSFTLNDSGDFVGISRFAQFLFVPENYVSGQILSSSSTFFGTFSSIGITPGTYVWTWGTGPDQNFTLDAVATGVPDSGSTFGLFLLSFAALFGASRFRSQQSA
jgi:hypothetical protein